MITLKQLDGALVTPQDDAILYDHMVSDSGLFFGCEVTHLGANQLRVADGRGIIQGRTFVVEAETVLAELATEGTGQGRLLIRVDLRNTEAPVGITTQVADTLPGLVQENINADGSIYELPLAVYDVEATQIGNLENTSHIVPTQKKNLEGLEIRVEEAFGTMGILPAEITYTGGTFAITADIPAPQTRATVMGYTAQAYAAGNTVTINGVAVTLTDLTGEPLSDGAWGNDSGLAVPVQLMIDLSGATKRAFFKTGGVSTPSIFGDGSDGDFYLYNNQTHIEPVPVAHQSIIIKQYKSFVMEAGSLYKCAANNAGLVILVQENSYIKGTIDQSGLAPKTNPNNNYPYPAQLICGDGGNGGNGGRYTRSTTITEGGIGGIAMLKRPYGGGFGAGGAAGSASGTSRKGGNGGDTSSTTVDVPDSMLFRRSAANYGDGINGGGGNGVATGGGQGAGAAGAGYNGSAYGGSAGAGNYGGGVVLLYVGGTLNISGNIRCNGLSGGNGGYGYYDSENSARNGAGGGAGGGGGGAIYLYVRGTYINTGLLQVNGGSGGGSDAESGNAGSPGSAGGVGSITIVKPAA